MKAVSTGNPKLLSANLGVFWESQFGKSYVKGWFKEDQKHEYQLENKCFSYWSSHPVMKSWEAWEKLR